MKYGETLRQRSIPAWSHHNIDYDDVKHLIKEETSPGKGRSISIPGQGDEKLVGFENTLFAVLAEQHNRIDDFVRSKAGEIQRRVDHVKKQLDQLSSRSITAADYRIPIGRLERYGKVESDVLKAGDEIRSLARFTGTQRTAFRKLLKKYKKWTGSSSLELRFRDDVLDNPKSFTNLDLGPLLDEYSVTLLSIRELYESGVQRSKTSSPFIPPITTSVIAQLQDAIRRGSRVEFDTATATIPLGDQGEVANYFVHSENVVELQVSLLQYMQFYTTRSRSNSVVTPITPATPRRPSGTPNDRDADYFVLVADNLDRFAQEQSTITVKQRERAPGISPQMAKAFIRWNDVEDAILSVRTAASGSKSATLKRKQIDAFFDRSASPPKKAEINNGNGLVALRHEILKDPKVHALYKLSSCRSRFVGFNDGPESLTLATLDSSISMQSANATTANVEMTRFPFAVLQVRKEGSSVNDLLKTLDASHLVERVRGFSLQYHALWSTCQTKDISAPFWLPMLSQDIRKLPPPALKRYGTRTESGSGSPSATQGTASTGSVRGFTDSTTAVESSRPGSSVVQTHLDAPPLRSFRKKRRRPYAEWESPQQKYWSEYDHPEELGEDGDAFVIYIDPNEKSTLDRLFDKLGGLFSRREISQEERSLLEPPTTPEHDDTSDEEEEGSMQTLPTIYGTLPRGELTNTSLYSTPAAPFLPQITGICFFASISILTVAYILATTSKHKFHAEVDVGIIFAVACGLAFAVLGFVPLLRRTEGTWVSLGVAAAVLVINILAAGLLLAWVLG